DPYSTRELGATRERARGMARGSGAAGFRAGAVAVPPWSAFGPRRGSPDQPERDRHGARGPSRVPDPLEDPVDRRPLRSQLDPPDLTQAGWRLRYRAPRDDEPPEPRSDHRPCGPSPRAAPSA